MALKWIDPNPTEGEVLLTRALMDIWLNDIRYLALVTSVIPVGSVAHGAGGPGLENVPLGAGDLLTSEGGTLYVLRVLTTGNWVLGVQNNRPVWIPETEITNGAKRKALVRYG